MKKTVKHSKIYREIVDILAESPTTRASLIEKCLGKLALSSSELADKTAGSLQNNLRSRIGSVINEMQEINLISIDKSNCYYLVSDKPVIIRIEKCESEIIKALSEKKMTKSELRNRLKNIFGTNKTTTTKDDDTLSTYMGQILKRLLSIGIIIIDSGKYSLSPKVSARADDLNAVMELKSDFLSRIHSRGGEFFENYFMTLIKKYVEKHGKSVLESYVTGGSMDGGIDGIIKTEDSLGFRETIMVQTKNRIEVSSETDVRGFYGAVCAKRGTRGIFVTSSSFHNSAKAFLDALDDCVGIDGDGVFSMAVECSYGIKKIGQSLEIDNKLI